MDLDDLTNQPSPIEIAGRTYLFSELPFESLGALQKWVKDNHPHPLRALRGQLDGFTDEEKAELLSQAREEAKHWPPVIGTARGAAALLRTESGQMQALWVALKVHQPDTSEAEARRLYKALEKEAATIARRNRKSGGDAEAKVSRIFAVAFGLAQEDEGDDADPKAG